MDDWQPLLASVVGAVAGFFARGEYARFTERGRLPGDIAKQLDMLERLPDGLARNELQRHVERQVRYLVAYEQPRSFGERLMTRYQVLAVSFGMFSLLLVRESPELAASPARWAVFLISGVCLLFGVLGVLAVLARRFVGKLVRLRDADSQTARGER